MNKSFWANLIKDEGNTIICCVVVVATCLAWITAQNNHVKISSEGIEVTKTAIANQAQLEQALLLIELQQQEIAEIKAKAIAINKRTNVGGALVNDLAKVEAILPPSYVNELEQTIEQSESILYPDNNYDIRN